jgi:hypothetical protein
MVPAVSVKDPVRHLKREYFFSDLSKVNLEIYKFDFSPIFWWGLSFIH